MTKKGYKQTEEHRKKISENHRRYQSEETKIKLSISKKGKISKNQSRYWKGKHLPKEMKIKISNTLMGRKLSKETKDKIGRGNRGYQTYETRIKISKAHMGKLLSEEHKNNLRIAHFNYIKNVTGISYPNVGRYEKQILDELQNRLGFSIKRQFYINGYFLDGYCQELNLAIEIDEEKHYKNDILSKKDIDKQNNIINSLGCNFLRLRVNEIIKEGKLNNSLLNLNMPEGVHEY